MTVHPAPLFSLSVNRGPERAVLALRGELDLDSAPQFRDRLLTIIDEGGGDVVLDLADLSFIDSTGLGVVVTAARHLRSHGRELILSRPTTSTYKILEITGLHQALRVTRDPVYV